MSRSYSSYDADWQRRKSVLIRNLFHDIPILSPVEEESNDSSQDYYVPTQEPFPSPPRPYSPLPPLIIEKIPITNKHDEPEDYYNKLYNKIKRIYKNLFIDKRNFSSIDYDSNYNDTSVNDSDSSVEILDFHFLESNDNSGNDKYTDKDNFDSIIADDERDARQSFATTKSDGYGADFESMDTAIIDVVNYTPSNEEGLIVSEEEESDSESIDGDDITNDVSDSSTTSDSNESSKKRIDYPEFREREESCYSIIDDHEMTEGAESNEPEDEQSYEKKGADSANIDGHNIIEETSETGESDTIINNLGFCGGEESHHSSSDDHEKSESEETNEIEGEPQPNNVTQRKLHSFVKEIKSTQFEKTASEDGNELIESNVEPMEAKVESSDSSELPVYRQITTAAMVHFDGTRDAEERESQVYEDSAKSVILPTWSRRVMFRRNDNVGDRIEVLQILEDNADSNTTPSSNTDESETTEEDFEEAAIPTLEAKEEGIIETRATQLEEDDEQMSTSRQDNPEEDGEEMTTSQPESAEEDIAGMGHPQLAARDEETEEMRIPLPKATEKDVEEIDLSRLDAPEEDDEKVTTPQPESPDKDIKVMGTQPAARNEETEEMGNPLPEATVEDVEGMSTPRLDAPEEDNKEMTTPQARSTEEDVEGMEILHPTEQMRTPRPNLSHETIPITHRSHSESTSEHTAAPQAHTALTSSSQDGADTNISELQTSNDMNEILTSIFNESRNKDRTHISGRKRKLVDKSVQAVQTSRVTWEEMRANFFVGTPKIFRLCACTDHICY